MLIPAKDSYFSGERSGVNLIFLAFKIPVETVTTQALAEIVPLLVSTFTPWPSHFISLASSSLNVFESSEQKNILKNLTSFSIERSF